MILYMFPQFKIYNLQGNVLGGVLSDFYTDPKDERFISRYAIFHQRFSINTAPSWDLPNL